MSDQPKLRAAIYARVSTFDQERENQLVELRQYVERRDTGAQSNSLTEASQARRTDALASTSHSLMLDGGSLTWWSAGD